MAAAESNPYVRGPATYRSLPRFETKPTTQYTDRRHDTGGGYERVRSYEHDPTKAGDRKRDVYAAIHRLCAVAWLLPPDAPLATLDGMDVHHTTGVEWANFDDSPNFDPEDLGGYDTGLALLEHGRHSEITQAQMRAWAEDAKREVERKDSEPIDGVDRCAACGAADDVSLWTSADFDGERCTACAMDAAEGGTLQEA